MKKYLHKGSRISRYRTWIMVCPCTIFQARILFVKCWLKAGLKAVLPSAGGSWVRMRRRDNGNVLASTL